MGLILRLSMVAIAAYATSREDAAELPGEASPYFVTVIKLDKESGLFAFRFLTVSVVSETVMAEEQGKRVKKTTLRQVPMEVDCHYCMNKARFYDVKGEVDPIV